jgi:spoIIIJ-associated protein
MNEKKIIEKIKKETEIFFEKMSFGGEIRVEPSDESSFLVVVKIEQPQILIGRGGETLTMIQNLLIKILRKKIKEDLIIDLDINEYKKRKTNFLKELAQITADEVALKKEEKELEPMPAYERRIIHLALAERKDVQTESRGQEPRRRVVIKPS